VDTLKTLLVPLSLLLLALAYLIGGRLGQVMAIVAAVGAGVAALLTVV
jgi:hypothetical protein